VVSTGGQGTGLDSAAAIIGALLNSGRCCDIGVDRTVAEEMIKQGGRDKLLLVTHRLRRPAMDETGAELIVSGTAPSAQRSGFAWCEKPVC
jgi:hypothetical protein